LFVSKINHKRNDLLVNRSWNGRIKIWNVKRREKLGKMKPKKVQLINTESRSTASFYLIWTGFIYNKSSNSYFYSLIFLVSFNSFYSCFIIFCRMCDKFRCISWDCFLQQNLCLINVFQRWKLIFRGSRLKSLRIKTRENKKINKNNISNV